MFEVMELICILSVWWLNDCSYVKTHRTVYSPALKKSAYYMLILENRLSVKNEDSNKTFLIRSS